MRPRVEPSCEIELDRTVGSKEIGKAEDRLDERRPDDGPRSAEGGAVEVGFDTEHERARLPVVTGLACRQ